MAVDPILLEIYRHRFIGAAEEMGVTLQRTGYSPNIKERLDYSCAAFDAEGNMVAQAAHIPVHLGAM
ncbi:MAG: hydantoinase B/oxoprolinase family protein, partial [Rhodothermaceae bacterium]|nr:hydantoinase B/oxoprolinase family protein [Rhodothermaceae bacterium]MYI85109.1 hydantoinase B/oxoprolinase family protein [Rhodothermaceae bacterium]